MEVILQSVAIVILIIMIGAPIFLVFVFIKIFREAKKNPPQMTNLTVNQAINQAFKRHDHRPIRNKTGQVVGYKKLKTNRKKGVPPDCLMFIAQMKT